MYQFTKDRRGLHPQSHLADDRGFIHTDSYTGFNPLLEKPEIIEVACIAHNRRTFVDLVKSPGFSTAEEAVRQIAELHRIEQEIRGKPPDERWVLRQTQAKLKFYAFATWLRHQQQQVSAKSALGKAIRYGLTSLTKLKVYLEHGHLELDNNAAERSMRCISVELPVRWLRGRRQGRGYFLYTDRNRKIQWRRSSGLAHRNTCPHR